MDPITKPMTSRYQLSGYDAGQSSGLLAAVQDCRAGPVEEPTSYQLGIIIAQHGKAR